MTDSINFLQGSVTDTDIYGNTMDNNEYNRRFTTLKTFINTEDYPELSAENVLQLRSLLKYVDPKMVNATTFLPDERFNLSEMLDAFATKDKSQDASLVFWENAVKSGSDNFKLDVEGAGKSATYETVFYNMIYTIPNDTKKAVAFSMCCGLIISGSDAKVSSQSTNGKVNYDLKFQLSKQQTESQKRFAIVFIKLYHIMSVCVNRHIVKLAPKEVRQQPPFSSSAVKLLSAYWGMVDKQKGMMQYFVEPTFRIACLVKEPVRKTKIAGRPDYNPNTTFLNGNDRSFIRDKKTGKATRMTAPNPMKIDNSEEFVAAFTYGSKINTKIKLPGISVGSAWITVKYNATSCEVYTAPKEDDTSLYAAPCDEEEYEAMIENEAISKYQTRNAAPDTRSSYAPSLASQSLASTMLGVNDDDEDENKSLNNALDEYDGSTLPDVSSAADPEF